MPFPLQIDILDLIFKGILIGIIASAPMGPVGVLCIQRTLNKGRWYGFITGVGATVSDIIYAMFTGLGMSFIMNLISNPTNLFWLKIIGSVILMAFGIYCYRSNPTRKIHASSTNHFLQSVDHIPIHGDFRSAHFCDSTQAHRDDPRLSEHRRRCPPMVVWADLARKQDKGKI